MPKIGQVMESGTVVKWRKADGDRVEGGEVIVEVETDKATYEIEAPAAGVLRTRAVEGDEVGVDGLLAVIEGAVGQPAFEPPAATRAASTNGGVTKGVGSVRVVASPKARRRAAELGVDLATVVASGADGVISAEDVEAAAGERPAQAPGAQAVAPQAFSRAVRERRPLTGLRRAGARRLQASWSTIPHIVQMIDVDASSLLAERERLRAAGTEATLNDLLIRAAAKVLAGHPDLNATIEGDDLVLFDGIDAGLAVDTERGLSVPVVRGADRLDVVALAAETRRLVEAARSGGLRGPEVGSASFSVSNLGAWGIRAGTPVIAPGEPMLIFVGAIEDRPVVEAGLLGVRPMVTLSIAFDHRVADGVAAAAFTRDLKDALEMSPSASLPGRAGAALGHREAALTTPGFSYEMRVRSIHHAWSLDEPEDDGGTNLGPTPVEAFLGSLISCLVITLKAVCKRRNVPLERVEAWTASNASGHITAITVELDVWTSETQEAMEALLVRAKRGCYVSGVLKPEIAFDVELRVHGGLGAGG